MAKTKKNMLDDAELEVFFDAAKSRRTEASEVFLMSIVADASAQQVEQQQAPALSSFANLEASNAGRSLWSRIVSGIGGWPAVAGMASATVAGVWIGLSSPAQLEVLSGGLIVAGNYSASETEFELEDLEPSYFGGSFLMEDDG